MVENTVNKRGQYKDIQFKIPECKICDELEHLLNTKNLSDVILSVNRHEFHAHKAILAARSPVFSAMFEHEMKEKRHNRVEISDIDQKVVGEMLCFMYTGRAPKLETMAANLLAVADKYALDRLKVMCEEALSKNLSVESAARALVLADKHSADHMKSFVTDFMTTHGNDVVRTLATRKVHEFTEACTALITTKEPPVESTLPCSMEIYHVPAWKSASQICRKTWTLVETESPETDPIILGTESWCHTKLKVTRFSNTWTIHNFSLRSENTGEALTSSLFSSSENDNVTWCLKLYPKGSNEDSKDYLSLFLHLDSAGTTEVNAAFKVCVLNAKLEKTGAIEKSSCFTLNKSRGWEKFIKLNFLFDKSNNLLPDDKLKVHCELRVLAGSENESGEYKRTDFKVPECKIRDQLEQLLDTQKLSDVILSVNGHEFPVHKAILAARSPVFSAMFELDMVEKTQNLVEITYFNHEVVGEMLRFIYTGRAPKLETMAADLLAVADKFGLYRLKAMCEEALSKNLTVESATLALHLADKHSADQLKTYAIDFMTKHGSDVMKSLVQRQLHRLTEICRVLTTQEEPSV